MKQPVSIEAVRTVWEATAPISKLGRWFTQNYAAFRELKRPRWEAMAVTFAEAGLIEVSPEFWSKDTHQRGKLPGVVPGKRLGRHERVKRQQKAAAAKAAAADTNDACPAASAGPIRATTAAI
jgi:hypothetical protein